MLIRLVLILGSIAIAFDQSSSFLSAQEAAPAGALELQLWPNGAPLAVGTDAKDIPTLIVTFPEGHAQATSSFPVLIVCPGGGYGHLAIGHEGHQISSWANEHGMVAAICTYRHRGKGYGHPAPLMDAQRAIRLVRSKADEFKVDPNRLGIMGFSAGGHLVSTVLTHTNPIQPDGSFLANEINADSDDVVDRQSSRPNFGILCYPVIGMGVDWTHKGSEHNLLGKDAAPELLAAFNSAEQVTADTPPTFLFHTQEDKAVPIRNSLEFYTAMCEHNVPGELHVFQNGQHGVGLAHHMTGAQEWPNLAIAWLTNRGIFAQEAN